jgi:hypothetical protein
LRHLSHTFGSLLDANATQRQEIVSSKTMSQKGNGTPKPYSAYIIFWRLERMYILQQEGCIGKEIKTYYDPNHHDPLEHPRPAKYANLLLPPYWYSSAQRNKQEKKRRHRKQDGYVDKNDLTSMIAKSWREIDTDVRNYVSRLASAEKAKYRTLRRAILREEQKQESKPLRTNPRYPVILQEPILSFNQNSEAQQISMDSTLFNSPSHDEDVTTFEGLSDTDLSLFDSNSLKDDFFEFNFSEGDGNTTN